MRTLASLIVWLFTLPAWSLELVMVEQKGCIYCARWDEEIASIYPKTELGQKAPLRRVDLHDVGNEIDTKSAVIYTPTFLFIEDNIEVGRLEGYISAEFFWGLGEAFVINHQKEQ